MKTLVENLRQYAGYHRNSRNVATHCVGIPMIVLAVTTLLSRPSLQLGALSFSPALLAAVAAAWYYLRLDRRFGVAMSVLLALSVYISAVIAASQPCSGWSAAWVYSSLAGCFSSLAIFMKAKNRPLLMM